MFFKISILKNFANLTKNTCAGVSFNKVAGLKAFGFARKSPVSCLLLQLKFRSPRGASHHPAFVGNCQTISHTFYSLIYPADEGNEVWIQSIAWGRVQEFGIWKIEIRDKKCVTLLGGSEMSVGWHFISLILGFWSCRMAAVAVSPWPSDQHNKTQPLKPQSNPQYDRNNLFFICSFICFCINLSNIFETEGKTLTGL